MKKIFGFALAACAALGLSHAAVIEIDSTDPNNAVELILDAGTYDVSFIAGTDSAWNAWGRVSGCASDGTGCSRGWLTNAKISSAEFGEISFGTHGRFQTAALALANAMPTSFSLSTRQSVKFFISDSHYADNRGGITLQVASAAVPVPAAGLLLGSVLLAMRGAFRRK